MDWKPLDRPASLIRLEEEQKEKSEIPLPGVLIEMPNKSIRKKDGLLTNLRKDGTTLVS
jgi:hypothetical protein